MAIMTKTKSVVGRSVFNTFDLENVVADVLHASLSSFSELTPPVSSDFNTEVMVSCYLCEGVTKHRTGPNYKSFWLSLEIDPSGVYLNRPLKLMQTCIYHNLTTL